MAQDYPGFLTETQREYLAASDEKRKKMREANPNITGNIRRRLNGVEKDWNVIFLSDANCVNGIDMTESKITDGNPPLYSRTNEKVQTGLKATLAQAHRYGNNDIIDLDGKSPDKVLDDLENKQEKMREYMAKSVIRGLIDSSEDVEGFSDAQLRRLIEIVFPEKEQTQEIIVEEFSNR